MNLLITPSMDALAAAMKAHAERGWYNGRYPHSRYFRLATQVHAETGASLIFTRDVGMHSCGWFKNPDFERCYHLSVAFHDLATGTYRPFEPMIAEAWVRCFYGERVRYVWEEGPRFDDPAMRQVEVHHYRVMCDPRWQPIIPRGEVYSKELTETGWKSWSEQQYARGRQDPPGLYDGDRWYAAE